MKKLYTFLAIASLCLFMIACSGARSRFSFTPTVDDRTAAVIEVTETKRSKTDTPDTPPAVTSPTYFEVIAARTTAVTTTKSDLPTESMPTVTTKTDPLKEQFIVKFVDIDGYSTISVQNIEAGGSAVEPAMPSRRNGTIFLGWDKNFSNIQSSLIIKAIYQKEWLTVRFFDADGTLLKSEEVLYGESAAPPEVSDKDVYIFAGWDKEYTKISRDIDIYATYYAPPQRSFTTLPDAYSLLTVKENTLGLPESAYYRREFNGVCTLGSTDYAGNIIYGNFSDTLDISGFGFKSFEGMLALKQQSANDENTYAINLYIYVDGEQVNYTQVTQTGAYRTFKVDLTGAKTLTVRLEQFVNGQLYYQYYGTPKFIGGLIDAVIYEN